MESSAGGTLAASCPCPDHDLTTIISTFRCAAYLPAAIESALHTSTGSILVADDGSGLEDPRVAERYEKEYPGRVRLLRSRRRRGAAKNVNQAVERVETQFFLKLDGADVLIPGYVETAFRTIASCPTLAVIAGLEQTTRLDEALSFRPDLLGKFPAGLEPTVLSGANALRFVLNWNPGPCPSGVIYRTAAFRKAGGFDPALKWGEDWEIWLRLSRQGDIACYEAPSALYRVDERSVVARHRRCFAFDAVVRGAAANCSNKELRPLLRRSFVRAAGIYAASAGRHLMRLRKSALLCSCLALRALVSAGFLPRSGANQNDLRVVPRTGPTQQSQW
jgi:glycosyltransferase involved in cell wall biosynthesis